MTLATHIVTGAAVAGVLTKDPTAAFLAGWVSHYLLDALPHWDYPIASFEAKDEQKPLEKKVEFGVVFVKDVVKVLTDACLGFVLLYITIWGSGDVSPDMLVILLAGAFGGVFPDFLQFLYGVWNVWPLRKLQEFHHFIHADLRLDDRPRLGVPMQIGIISFAGLVLLAYLLGN